MKCYGEEKMGLVMVLVELKNHGIKLFKNMWKIKKNMILYPKKLHIIVRFFIDIMIM